MLLLLAIFQEFPSVPRVVKEEGRTNRLVRLEEKELGLIIKNNVNNVEGLARWKPMEMSYSFPANFFLNWTRPIVTSLTLDGKPLEKAQDCCGGISLMPNKENVTSFGNGIRESPQTLELFPLRSEDLKRAPSIEDTKVTSERRDSDFNTELSLSFLL